MMAQFPLLVPVFLAAGLGGVLRWVLGLALGAHAVSGTLVVNLVGGFLIGLVAGLPVISSSWKVILMAGFLGGLTTFSAFSLETLKSLSEGRFGGALLYVAVSVFGALILCRLGLFVSARF